jgi:xyloglucan-specific endo-beta-1,4-glucanase
LNSLRLAKYGNLQPIGTKKGTAHIGGHTWDLWAGNGTPSMKTYSFVAQGTANHWSGDIKQFFDHLAQNHNFPAHDQHLLSKFIGV